MNLSIDVSMALWSFFPAEAPLIFFQGQTRMDAGQKANESKQLILHFSCDYTVRRMNERNSFHFYEGAFAAEKGQT